MEGWSQYENDVPLRAWSAAASRTAIAPFLAYRSGPAVSKHNELDILGIRDSNLLLLKFYV